MTIEPSELHSSALVETPIRDTWQARHVPKALWARLRADPVRAPEHIALAAGELHGPAAASWVARAGPEYGERRRALAGVAVRQHVRYSRLSGGATGIGGFTTMAADIASLAWIQSRMVFFVAAAFGWDPLDPMRPAEVLVLQGVYDDPYAARAGLDGTGETMAEAYVGSLRDRDRRLVQRLLLMVGTYGAKRLGGRAIPGFAIAFNAIANGGDTKDLGRRAMTFYGGPA
jgi:EcsC protein family